MKKLWILIILGFLSLTVIGQDCTILSKANNISPDKLCAPVTATWNVSYTGVNNNGTLVQIRYDWDDGNVQTINANNLGGGVWDATLGHVYGSNGNLCNYRPRATLIVNGVTCGSSTQEQIVTVWDDDDHNGGIMRINPRVYPICFGEGANVQFRDNTRFNCVPPQENDVPNLYTRWVQWIYGTDITMTGVPITVNGNPEVFSYSAPVITLPGPVTGSGVLSDIINVANDKLVGEYFEITLRNWNYCNPYDDPNIPGPPVDLVNGDNPPVTTTAIILIVPLPDATIIPMDTLCVDNDPINLTSVNGGGIWVGNGVIGNTFDPTLAGVGNHTLRYTITTGSGCVDWDETIITVEPVPIADITPVGTVYANDSPISLTATPINGIWTGTGINGSVFYPDVAGVGTHIIMYETLPDNNGCTGIDTIHINVILPPLPIAEFSPDTTGCSPLTVQFINNSINGETYLWEFGDNTYSDELNPLHIFHLPGDYIVKLTTRSISGEDIYYGQVSVYQNPITLFEIYPYEIVNDNQIIKTINNSLYADFYSWNFGDGSTSNEFQPWYKYELEGTYNIQLTTISINGCIDSLMFHTPIEVSFNIGDIKFANAFKWNQSGPTGGYWNNGSIDNTVFHPHFYNVIEYNMLIYNRWGELIYESNDVYKGWDGYLNNGKKATQGVYVYKVIGKYTNGETFFKVGDVTFLH